MDDELDILLALQARFASDRAQGEPPSLASYLALFPGHEEIVAREYFALTEPGPESATNEGPPARLGPYRIEREIGRGGQGIVYRAYDEQLHRHVALKVLHRGHDAETTMLPRFQREARVVSGLDHPGICTVFDFGEGQGEAWIAMRLIEGEPLSRWLTRAVGEPDGPEDRTELEAASAFSAPPKQSPAFPGRDRALVQRLLLVLESAARALHAAHEAGVIHRDIKPANLMVTPDDSAVITDFGLARQTDSGHTLTIPGDLFGTPAYLSPEQLRSDHSCTDHRADIWSLGVVAYECFFGQKPFLGATRDALYRAILVSPLEEPRALLSRLPRGLFTVLSTALAKDPNHRYQDAQAFADDLKHLRLGRPIAAKRQSAFGRLHVFVRSHPALSSSLALTILSLAIGLFASLSLYERARRETAAALAQEGRAKAAQERSAEALARFEQLSDLRLAEELIAAERRLWPRHSKLLPVFHDWLDRARQLIAHRPTHVSAYEELKAIANEGGSRALNNERARLAAEAPDYYAEVQRQTQRLADLKALVQSGDLAEDDHVLAEAEAEWALLTQDARYVREPPIGFASPKDAWRFEAIERLLQALSTLERLIPEVTTRLQAAEAFALFLEEDDRLAWSEAKTCLLGMPRYAGIALSPLEGLVPLGVDQDSGLMEFWHRPSGARPEWVGEFMRGRVRLGMDSGLVLVLIPAGKAMLGAQSVDPSGPNFDPLALSHEGPPREVQVAPFLMSKYEMTQAQYLSVMRANPSFATPGLAQDVHVVTLLHPVEQVDRFEADEVLFRLGLTLPTEVQWEYAARAGTSTPYATGETVASLQGYANLSDATIGRGRTQWTFEPEIDDGHASHAPVGSFRPNAFGLHDTHGNVWEWCKDRFSRLTIDPRKGDGLRVDVGQRLYVLRGGSFRDPGGHLRVATRLRIDGATRSGLQGLRPAMVLPPSLLP